MLFLRLISRYIPILFYYGLVRTFYLVERMNCPPLWLSAILNLMSHSAKSWPPLGASTVEFQAQSAMLAFQMGSGLSPSCSTAYPASFLVWKAAADG